MGQAAQRIAALDVEERAPTVLPPSPRRPLYRLAKRAKYHAIGLAWEAWHLLLRPGYPRPPPGTQRELTRRFEALLERDLLNVARGLYPETLLRQFPPGDYAWGKAFAELVPVLRRQRRNGWNQLPPGVELSRFPRYYRRTFHWQTDGWLSERSSRLYDISVGFLFRGTTDVMRRMAIAPLAESLREVAAPRVLDVACGNGRFLAQVGMALPEAKLTGLDLSPFYLKHVRERVPGAELVEGAAETLPLPDAAYDAVTCVYLFHEIPRAVRRAALAEIKRVLKPGGWLILADSIQRTDAQAAPIAHYIEWFPALYHEPFFKDYSHDGLGAAAARAGLEVLSEECHYLSKVVVARKPG